MPEGESTTRRALSAWRRTVFSTVAPGVRSKSGTDAVNLIASLVALALVVLAVKLGPAFERWWASIVVPPPQGISWLLTFLFFAGTFGATALLVGFAVVHRRRDLSIDLVVAFALGLGISYGMQFVLGATGGRPPDPNLAWVNQGFPVPVMSAVIAAAIVGRPYFARSVRQFFAGAIVVAFVGSATTGRAMPMSLIGSFLVGWASACAIHLWRGRPRVAADPTALAAAISSYGLAGVTLDATTPPGESINFGVDRVLAADAEGTLRISIYSRDSRDAEFLRSLWQWIISRDRRAAPFVGRQQQAEHEALVTASVRSATEGASAELTGLTSTSGGQDVLVITRPVAATRLGDLDALAFDADARRAIAQLVARAHRGHVALGCVDLEHLAIDAQGVFVVDDPLEGSINPTQTELYQDVAATLVVMALGSDVDSSLSSAVEVFGHDKVAASLSYLQKAAISVSLAKAAKSSGNLLVELQGAGAKALGVEEVKLVPLRRVSAATLVLAIGTLIGGWALLGVLVNVAGSISTLRGADVPWVIATFVVAQAVFPALALTDEGSVTGSMPYGLLNLLEVSNTFSGLAMGTAGTLAARVRFMQRQGYDATVAVSSGVLISMVSWMVKGGLFIICLPLAWSSMHISTSPSSSGDSKGVELVLIVIGVLAVVLGAVLMRPRWRHAAKDKLTPKYHEVRDHLKALSEQPKKLVEIFGGNLAAQIVIAMALGCALHAFDTRLGLATLIVVLTIGSAVGGLSPVPGGMGVVEAGMILALTWFGVPQNIAVSAVFVQRLFTAYLPPIWGYVSLIWLRRHEYL